MVYTAIKNRIIAWNGVLYGFCFAFFVNHISPLAMSAFYYRYTGIF